MEVSGGSVWLTSGTRASLKGEIAVSRTGSTGLGDFAPPQTGTSGRSVRCYYIYSVQKTKRWR